MRNSTVVYSVYSVHVGCVSEDVLVEWMGLTRYWLERGIYQFVGIDREIYRLLEVHMKYIAQIY